MRRPGALVWKGSDGFRECSGPRSMPPAHNDCVHAIVFFPDCPPHPTQLTVGRKILTSERQIHNLASRHPFISDVRDILTGQRMSSPFDSPPTRTSSQAELAHLA